MNKVELAETLTRIVATIKAKRREVARKVKQGAYGIDMAMDSLRDSESLLATMMIENINTITQALDPIDIDDLIAPIDDLLSNEDVGQ